jgi:hypothetical protein
MLHQIAPAPRRWRAVFPIGPRSILRFANPRRPLSKILGNRHKGNTERQIDFMPILVLLGQTWAIFIWGEFWHFPAMNIKKIHRKLKAGSKSLEEFASEKLKGRQVRKLVLLAGSLLLLLSFTPSLRAGDFSYEMDELNDNLNRLNSTLDDIQRQIQERERERRQQEFDEQQRRNRQDYLQTQEDFINAFGEAIEQAPEGIDKEHYIDQLLSILRHSPD